MPAVNCSGLNPHFLKLVDDIEIWAGSSRTRKNLKDPMEAVFRLAKTDFNMDLKHLMYDTTTLHLTKGSGQEFIRRLGSLNTKIENGSIGNDFSQFFWQSSHFGRKDPVIGSYLKDMQKSSFEFRSNELNDRGRFKSITTSLIEYAKNLGLSDRYGLKNSQRYYNKLDKQLIKAINDKDNSTITKIRREIDTVVSSTNLKVFDDFIHLVEGQMPKALKEKYNIIKSEADGGNKKSQKIIESLDSGEQVLRLNDNDIAKYMTDADGMKIQDPNLYSALSQYNNLMEGLHKTLRFGVDKRIDSMVERLRINGDQKGADKIDSLKELLRGKLMPKYEQGFFPHYVRDLTVDFMDGLMPHLDNMQGATDQYNLKKKMTIEQAADQAKLYISGHAKSRPGERGDYEYSRNFLNTVSNYIADVNRFNYTSYMDAHYLKSLSGIEQIYRKDGNAKGYAENVTDYVSDLHKAANGDNNIPENTRALMRSLLGIEFISKLGVNPRAAARNFSQRLLDYVEWGPVMIHKLKAELKTMTFKGESAENYIESILNKAGLLFEEVSPEFMETGLAEPASMFKMRRWNEATGKFELIEKSNMSGVAGAISTIAAKSSWLHRKAENSNRKHTFKIAYAQMHRMLNNNPSFRSTQKNPEATARAVAENYAKEMVILNHFDYADYAKSPAVRSKLGRFMLQFQHYSFEFFERNAKIAKEAKGDLLAGKLFPNGEARGMEKAYRMAIAYFIAPIVAGMYTGVDFSNLVAHDTGERIKQLTAALSGDDEKIEEAFYGKGPLLGTLGGPLISDIIDIGIMMDVINLDKNSLFTIIAGLEEYDRNNTSTDLSKKIRLLNSFAGRTMERHWPSISKGQLGWAIQQELGLYPTAEKKKQQKRMKRIRKQVIPKDIDSILRALEEGKYK